MGLLYTKMKIFHYTDKINSLPKNTDKIMPPIHIRIKPTNVCNHNCSYCAYRAEDLQLGKDMVIKDYIPLQKMMEIIDDVEEMGVKAITFSGGGEPFLYPYLLDAVKRLSETPVKFAALTNGSRLTGEVAEIFAQHGTWLRISIDGWDDESYSKYRGVPHGEFTKVMDNIKHFKLMKGKCLMGVSIIVDQTNSSHLYNFIKKLKDIGVDSVKIAPCVISNNVEENNTYHKPIFDTVKVQIEKSINELKDNNFEIFDSYHRQLETFEKRYSWCPYLQILPVIGADQNVYACHDTAYDFENGLIGSIKNTGFKKFWFADKNIFFKIDPSLHCNHHCVVNENNKLILEYLGADEEHMGFV